MKYIQIAYLQLIKALFPKGRFLKLMNTDLGIIKFWFDQKTDNGFIVGFYEPKLISLIKENLDRKQVFYDLGAHWGYFSLIASKIVGEKGYVHSFEPNRNNFDRLNMNFSVNKFNNMKIFEKAVSNKNGTIFFTDSEDSYANSYKTVKEGTDKIKVKTISLDSHVYEDNFAPPNFVKIDVEGAEYDVLVGAQKVIKEFSPLISISTHEIHNKGVDTSCISFLEKMNYSIELYFEYKNGLIRDYICIPNDRENQVGT